MWDLHGVASGKPGAILVEGAEVPNQTGGNRDPETGQFLPGNPGGGRPNGSVSLLSALKRYLRKHPDELDAIAENLAKMAQNGDAKHLGAIRTLLERLDGPVPTVLEGSDDKPITVTIRRTGQTKPE